MFNGWETIQCTPENAEGHPDGRKWIDDDMTCYSILKGLFEFTVQ